jgi:hypothetical protein
MSRTQIRDFNTTLEWECTACENDVDSDDSDLIDGSSIEEESKDSVELDIETDS